MDFTKFFVFYIFYTLLAILGIMGEDEEICGIPPQEAEKVNVVIYMNGESSRDLVWIGQYVKWLGKEFSYSQYTSLTIKIGGHIVCDKSNICSCPSRKDNSLGSCDATFKHVCVAQILSGDLHWTFLNCMRSNSFDACVPSFKGLAAKLKTCMDKTGPGSPQDIALQNAQEVIDKGVDTSDISEPYFFFDGHFNSCINGQTYRWWLQTICSMLKDEISDKIKLCKEAQCEVFQC